MRITHIITGLDNGGAEAVLTRLCLADMENEHFVISLTTMGKYGPILESSGIPVHCLNMQRGRLPIRAAWRLWKILRRERPNVAQTWMYHADLFGGVVARLAGIKNIIWNVRHSELRPGKSSRITILIARLSAKLSKIVPDKIIVCAKHAYDVHVALGYDRERMALIGNGYDLANFRPDSSKRLPRRAQLQLSAKEPVIGYVARFNPQKDHENLFRALVELRKRGHYVPTLLIGPGLDDQNVPLLNRLDTLGITDLVYLLGAQENVASWMNAIDLHVMSSSFGEGFPNVLAEAMACGTPCISTNVGDASHIIGDTGWLVEPRDPIMLADAIEKALGCIEDVEQWCLRKARARERIEENFSLESMVSSYRSAWGQ
ncbi:glycosyl transferase family 1 [Qipengyuania flava]|uniref:glycosyltransferase family 4 protein n=1 Tax=Qipengyuania flava TaxID=192812 RepID=UPI000B8BBD95|nr:glycosyltransferase [Qipengyuania flava]ASP29971.1 glycosyl transferase family 1 [Qipengyuania flava]